MKGMALLLLLCGVILIGAVAAFVGGPVEKLAMAGTGQMAIVPPSEPLAADCGQAASIADGACNVQVQEYDALTMLVLWGGSAILLICAVGFVLFAVVALVVR